MSQASPKRGHNSGILAAARALRRATAEQRAAARAERGPFEQRAVLDGRPGAAARERARLTEQINASGGGR